MQSAGRASKEVQTADTAFQFMQSTDHLTLASHGEATAGSIAYSRLGEGQGQVKSHGLVVRPQLELAEKWHYSRPFARAALVPRDGGMRMRLATLLCYHFYTWPC
jgi:hypothetical protein